MFLTRLLCRSTELKLITSVMQFGALRVQKSTMVFPWQFNCDCMQLLLYSYSHGSRFLGLADQFLTTNIFLP